MQLQRLPVHAPVSTHHYKTDLQDWHLVIFGGLRPLGIHLRRREPWTHNAQGKLDIHSRNDYVCTSIEYIC